MGISLRRLGKSLRDGTAVRRFWSALTLENSFPAVAFDGTSFALPAYGPELVSNGTFDADLTGWTADGSGDITASVVSGAMQLVRGAGGTAGLRRSDITLTPGKLYEIRYTVGTSTMTARVIKNGTAEVMYAANSAVGTATAYFTATSSTAYVGFWPFSTSTTSTVDNVSIREVMLGEMGTNLGASGYTMSTGGTGVSATESPTGTLNLTGGGTSASNFARGVKELTGLTVGRHYRLTFLCSGNFPSVFVGTTSAGTQVFQKTVDTGVNFYEFTATATTHYLTLNHWGASLATISSITIAEWTPRPTLRTVPLERQYGPELVTNGTFDTDLTGWATVGSGGTTTWQSGVARLAANGIVGRFEEAITVTPGKLYELSVDVVAYGGGATSAFAYVTPTSNTGGSSIATITVTGSAVGNNKVYFRPTVSTMYILLSTGAVTSGHTVDFDNVSVREVVSPGAFGNGSSLTGEVFAFTASSTTARTYVGADGLIKNDLAADAPRVDYSNGKARYLFENASTNLLLRSAEFDNASWTKTMANVTADAVASPDGSTSADRVTPTAVNGTHLVSQAATPSAASHTVSVFVKPDGYSKFGFRENGVTGARAAFNLSGSGSVIEVSSSTATINAWANGWYRVTITYTATAASHTYAFYVLDDAYTTGTPHTYLWTANGTSGLYIWGAQVEAQSFASSYIPTTSATVTRLIETPRFSPLVEAMFQLPGATARVQGLLIRPADTPNPRLIGAADPAAPLQAYSPQSAGTFNGSVNVGVALGSGTFQTGYGAVAAFNSSGRSVSGNGSSVATDTNTFGTRTTVYLARGSTVGAAGYGDGYYSSFALYPFRATNAGVSAIAVAPS